MRLTSLALAIVMLAGALPTMGAALADETSPAQPAEPTITDKQAEARASLEQAAAAAGPDPGLLDGLALADTTLSVQQDRLDGSSPTGMAELIEDNRKWATGLEGVVELVRDRPDSATAPAGLAPSQAAAALADQVDASLTDAERADLQRLDDLPAPWPAELADWIVAFQAFHAETQTALADLPRDGHAESPADVVEQVKDEFERVEDPSEVDLAELQPGVARVLDDEELTAIHDARDAFLSESLELRHLAAAQPAAAEPDVQACPAIAVGLANEPTTYEQNCALILDLGGSDTYRNNAGGAAIPLYEEGDCTGFSPDSIQQSPRAAALVDLGLGDDLYGDRGDRDICGVNGASMVGSGFLLDDGGDDRYEAKHGYGQAAAYHGTAALLDLGGNDVYTAAHSANAYGFTGTGILYDQGGNDEYISGGWSNGAGPLGQAALVDGGGNDRYSAGDFSNGGAGLPGSSLLLDVSGFDTYSAGGSGANGGGALGGQGLLADLSGDDVFNATSGATNGGGDLGGVGNLVDLSGDDTYVGAKQGANGGASLGSQGLLFDATGNDRYTAKTNGVNGGGNLAQGLLLDGSGHDVYEDAEGGTGTNKTVAPKGTVGAQIDGLHPPTQPADEEEEEPPTELPPNARPHVVVGDPDSGINPYHEIYHRPNLTEHPCTYVADYPCDIPALNLTLDAPDLKTAIEEDLEKWKDVDPGEWYWIPQTSIIAASCDDDGPPCLLSCSIYDLEKDDRLSCASGEHGTHTSSSVLMENPDALIAFRETAGRISAFQDRGIPVDVFSISYGSYPPSPAPSEVCPGDQDAPLHVASAGNGLWAQVANLPSSTFNSCRKGDPGTIAVGGAYAKDRTEEGDATKNPEVVSYFCRPTADDDSIDRYEPACGTSFGTPTVAGALSKVILDVRQHTGYSGNIDGKVLDPTYGDDGLTVGELRDAMNRTATYDPEPRYDNTDTGGSTPLNPVAPYTQWGWGFYDAWVANATSDHLLEEPVDPRPEPVRTYMQAQHTVKTALYGDKV